MTKLNPNVLFGLETTKILTKRIFMILQYIFLADDPPLIKYKTQLFRNVDVMFF